MNSNKDPDIKVREVTSPARLCVKDYGENRKSPCFFGLLWGEHPPPPKIYRHRQSLAGWRCKITEY